MPARPNSAPGVGAAGKWAGSAMLAVFIAFAPLDLMAQETKAPADAAAGLPKLLHASRAERSVENGVAVWRGATRPDALPLAGAEPLTIEEAAKSHAVARIEVRIVKRYPPRSLRTHRIFGQSPGASRRYTQGFYSDRVR